MTTAGPRRALARATSILPRGSGTVGVWVRRHRRSRATASSRSPVGPSAPERYGGALRALGARASCSAPAPASRSSRRCPGRSRAGAARGLGGGPARAPGHDRHARVRSRARRRLRSSRVRGSSTTCSTTRSLLLVGLILLLVGYTLEYLVRGVLAGQLALRTVRRSCSAPRAGSRLLVADRARRGRASRPRVRTASCSASRRSSACSSRCASRDGLVTPGPPAPWRELTRAFGWLLAGSLFAQALVNTGPILVQLLAPAKDDDGVTGQFLASLRHRAHSGLPVPRGAGRAAAAPAGPRGRGPGPRPRGPRPAV